jgi:uncharacterized membrane protein YbaN (DUF454 family)
VITRSRFIRATLLTVGTVSVILGVAGIFLPLLPTTPFLLLASACYLRSSERMHRWLLSHEHLGPYIRDFEDGRGLPLRAKLVVLALMWSSISLSAYLVDHGAATALLFAIAAAVTIWIVRMPTVRI